jgi:hypothetical protein
VQHGLWKDGVRGVFSVSQHVLHALDDQLNHLIVHGFLKISAKKRGVVRSSSIDQSHSTSHAPTKNITAIITRHIIQLYPIIYLNTWTRAGPPTHLFTDSQNFG